MKLKSKAPIIQAAFNIAEVLFDYGKECPQCFGFGFGPHVEGKASVCERCRGFGRVFNFASPKLDYPGTAFRILKAIDCPT